MLIFFLHGGKFSNARIVEKYSNVLYTKGVLDFVNHGNIKLGLMKLLPQFLAIQGHPTIR